MGSSNYVKYILGRNGALVKAQDAVGYHNLDIYFVEEGFS